MAAVRSWTGTVDPDFFQFYLRRSGAGSAAGDVSEEGRRDRLWTDGTFVVIGTLRRHGATTTKVDVLPAPPGTPGTEWQHVVDVSLAAGGPWEILSWADDEPVAVLDLPDEPLRLRVQWTGLVQGRFEGLADDGTSDERLSILAWPAPLAPREVIRRWHWPW